MDDPLLDGVVSRVSREHDTNESYGVLVDIRFTEFAPKSLVPKSIREDLESLVGKAVKCSVFSIDEERGTVILKIESVVDA